MASQQSDRACTLCRQRRVRCDKTLPTCRRCSKFGQTCPGYPSRQRFIDQSSAVRNKLNDQISPPSSTAGQQPPTSVDSSPRIPTGSTTRAAQRRRSHNSRASLTSIDHTQSFPVPKRSSISTTGNHVSLASPPTSHAYQQLTPASSLPIESPVDDCGVDILQPLEDPVFDYFDLDIDTYYANGNNMCGFFPGIPVSLPSDDGLGVLDGIHDSQLFRTANAVSTSAQPLTTSGARLNEVSLNKEVALLIHLFVDFLAPWMDLLDFDAYFTRTLPTDAMPNILLQSAVAAVAAKQTARYLLDGCVAPAPQHYAYIMANYQDVSCNEWFYKAACYYDRGISHLRAQLQQSSKFLGEETSPRPNTHTIGTPYDHPSLSTVSDDPRRTGYGNKNLQNLFSAISIFSLYESLDDALALSSQHLPGFLALFDNGSVPFIPQSLTAGRAAFWYFARKEALSSYAHHIKPRIDPENVSVWTSAGLPVQVLQLFLTQDHTSHDPSLLHHIMHEDRDAAHRILIWILTKVIDLIAPDSGPSTARTPLTDSAPIPPCSPLDLPTDGTLQDLSVCWSKLREFLTYWFDNRPCALTSYAGVDTKNPYSMSNKPLRVAFFSNPTAVAILQLYHFIQIILLINQPTKKMDQGSRLRMLKENSAEVEYHSREICAVASGRQPLAIQRHMSHPLQLAGAYFEAKEDRDAIHELLREVAIQTSSPIEVMG